MKQIAKDRMQMPLNAQSGLNAVDLLKEDHRKVKELFSQFEETRTKAQRMKVLGQILQELTVHATLEEKHVYPLLEREGETIKEAYVEHHVVKMLISELSKADGSESNLKAKVKVLSEMVDHHVQEEESEILPKLQEAKSDLTAFGAELQEQKQKLMAKIKKPVARKQMTASATRSKSRTTSMKTRSKSKGRTKKAG
jgi:hemerythrin superfamily protein